MADWKKVKKIDAHIHIIPDVVHEANPDSEDEWVYSDQSKYLNLMKEYNIEQAVIMPLNDPYLMSMELTVDAVNKNLKELVNKYPDKPRIITGKELALDLLYDITNPYGFRDWDWGEFKLYPDLDLEERINQFEILKEHKKELKKRREEFLK